MPANWLAFARRDVQAAAIASAGLPGQTEAQRALDYARGILSTTETRIFPSPTPLP